MFERKVNEFHYDVDIVNVDDIRLNDLFRQDVNSLPLSITNR